MQASAISEPLPFNSAGVVAFLRKLSTFDIRMNQVVVESGVLAGERRPLEFLGAAWVLLIEGEQKQRLAKLASSVRGVNTRQRCLSHASASYSCSVSHAAVGVFAAASRQADLACNLKSLDIVDAHEKRFRTGEPAHPRSAQRDASSCVRCALCHRLHILPLIHHLTSQRLLRVPIQSGL